jgi:hypothetical protein
MFSCDLANLTKRKGRLCEHALEHAPPGRDFGECGADTYVQLSYAAFAAGTSGSHRAPWPVDGPSQDKAEAGGCSFLSFSVAMCLCRRVGGAAFLLPAAIVRPSVMTTASTSPGAAALAKDRMVPLVGENGR